MILQNNELDLWRKVCEGDINAFRIIFENHYKSLCIHAMLLLKDEGLAEDIVQDVFLRLWTKRSELTQISNIASYLFTSVKNAALDELRKTKIIDDVTEVELSDEALDPFHAFRVKELNQNLQAAAASLPLQCKLIFEMVYIEGKKYQEVADELELSVNTIKTQLKRALAKMRIIMEKFR